MTGSNGSARREYLVFNAADEDAALAAVEAAVPATISGFPRDSIEIEDFEETVVIYVAIVEWRFPRPGGSSPSESDATFTFDTTGGRERVFQSFETIASVAKTGETAPDHKGAIGATPDGNVEGVEIFVPRYAWQEGHQVSSASMTQAYREDLAALTASVNNAAFRGFDAGEVICLGVTGTKRGEPGDASPWDLTFSFGWSPNRTGIEIGDLEAIDKDGHDYLWVLYDREEQTGEGLPARPRAAYVERVYPRADFAGLGIGTSAP